jgi:threonine/homoserine/homoserine lactone efflux protein
MSDLLPPWPLLSAFILASLALAVAPGPGVLYIVTRSLEQGRRAGIVSAAGVAFGNLGNAIVASVGLAALLAVSSLAFNVLKYAGALYLVFLGVRALRTKTDEKIVLQATSMAQIFGDGFTVALLNPKTAIFFAAFLPQFLSAADRAITQSIALGALFVAIASITDTMYAVVAGTLSSALAYSQRARTVGRYCNATTLIGLGALSAFSGARHGK